MKRNKTKITVMNLTVEYFILMKAPHKRRKLSRGLVSYLFSIWQQTANLIIFLQVCKRNSKTNIAKQANNNYLLIETIQPNWV